MRFVLAVTATAVFAVSACGASPTEPSTRRGQEDTVEQKPSPTAARSTRPGGRESAGPGAGNESSQRSSPAGPTRLVIPDRVDDVLHTLSEGDDNPKHVQYPRADLTRIVVWHARRVVAVREQIGDLRPLGYQHFQLQLRTSHRTYVVVAWVPRVTGVRRPLTPRISMVDENGSDRRVRCPEVSGEIDFDRDLLTFIVPRTCLDEPSWVRIIIWNILGDPDGEDWEDSLDRSQIRADGYSHRAYGS